MKLFSKTVYQLLFISILAAVVLASCFRENVIDIPRKFEPYIVAFKNNQPIFLNKKGSQLPTCEPEETCDAVLGKLFLEAVNTTQSSNFLPLYSVQTAVIIPKENTLTSDPKDSITFTLIPEAFAQDRINIDGCIIARSSSNSRTATYTAINPNSEACRLYAEENGVKFP